MSKKGARIKYLVGCRKALNTQGETGADGKLCYDLKLIKQILATIDQVLTLDGITAIPADAKVNVKARGEK